MKAWCLAASAVLVAVLGTVMLGPDVEATPTRQAGMSFAAWWPGLYSSPDSDLALTKLSATGADWISLIVTGYQDTVGSTDIYTGEGTPTDEDLIHVINLAHRLGLKVMLKPHVDPLDVGRHWRGEIGNEFTTEAQWAAWFTSYRSFVGHYATLAQTHGVDQFSVGCEFVGTAHREAHWRRVIAGVRASYSGPITYASNHSGEETSIAWWDALDYIGVDAYYPLTDKNNPTLAELKAAWAPHVAALAGLASRWGKPILLTEIGYRSQDGANRHPWDWQIARRVDLQEQADCYRAAFEELYNRPWCAGVFWWAWSPDPFEGGSCDEGYTPQEKPAEDVVRAWYGAGPRPAPTPTPLPSFQHRADIYTDALAPGWENWSWDARLNLAAADQVHSGTRAISTTLGAWGGLSLWHPAFSSDPYYWLEFYIRGAPGGEQHLAASFATQDDVELRARPVDDCRYMQGGIIEPGVWKRVRIPLEDLDATGRSLSRLSVTDRSGQDSTSFWVDDIRLVGTYDYPNTSPANGDVKPSIGGAAAGSVVAFTTTWHDPDGWQDLRWCFFRIGGATARTGCVLLAYDVLGNKLMMRSNDGTKWWGGYAPGSTAALQNARAVLHCDRTTVTRAADSVAVTWAVTFKSAFCGAKGTYLKCRDVPGTVTDWQKKGSWTIRWPPSG